MGEGNEERKALIHRFYRTYGHAKERSELRYHMSFDAYGNNVIEIWECEGGRKARLAYKLKGDTEMECYRRAIGILEMMYIGKEEERHEERAG